MSENLSVEVTGDGSTTLRNTELQETYHSLHGALTESLHVFIRAGLDHWRGQHPDQQMLRVFEMGFGTGLNAALAWQWADSKGIHVTFRTIELYPLSPTVTGQLSFPGVSSEKISQLHRASWGEAHVLSENFLFKKELGDIRQVVLEGNSAEIIFYDAFAPSRQPELWSVTLMRKMSDMLSSGGMLVSYCAQGQFKRNLREAGLIVESLPGPPGKREMVRAVKTGLELPQDV